MASENRGAEQRTGILIPTMDRPDFIERLLRYYQHCGYEGYLLIGDSSGVEARDRNRRLTEEHAQTLNVIYRYFDPKEYSHDGMVLRELIPLAPCPYLIFSGDDDFVSVNGLAACADALDRHPEYGGVRGVMAYFHLPFGEIYGDAPRLYPYPDLDLDSPDPLQRWSRYVYSTVSLQHYLYRKEVWQGMYEEVANVPSRFLGPEFLPCCVAALSARVVFINVLLSVLQRNDRPIVAAHTINMYDIITHPDWSQSLARIKTVLTGCLSRIAALSPEDAEREFSEKLHWKINQLLGQHYHARYESPTWTERLRSRVKRIGWLCKMLTWPWKLLICPAAKGRARYRQWFSLDSLLEHDSPYRDGFLPMYDTLCKRGRRDAR